MEICLQSAQHVVLRCSRSRERCVDAGNSPRLCVGGCPNCFPLLFPAGHCSLATIDTNTKYTKNTNTKKLNTQIQKLCGWRPPNCFPLVFPAGHWCPQPYICHCCCITSQVSFTICSPVTCHWLALTLLLNSVNSKNITFCQLWLMFLHSDMVPEIVYEKKKTTLLLFNSFQNPGLCIDFNLSAIDVRVVCWQASESNGLGIKSHFCLLTGSDLYSTEIGKKSKSPIFYRLPPQLLISRLSFLKSM